MLSVLGVKPGQMGDSIILSRLEKGADPVTVHIPTSKQQVGDPGIRRMEAMIRTSLTFIPVCVVQISSCSHSASLLQHPISWLVQEMDSILVEQKAVSCVSEKAKWWEGRRALDSRVEVGDEE